MCIKPPCKKMPRWSCNSERGKGCSHNQQFRAVSRPNTIVRHSRRNS